MKRKEFLKAGTILAVSLIVTPKIKAASLTKNIKEIGREYKERIIAIIKN